MLTVNSTDAKPRVFVSSVMREFEPFREAARSGIEAAGREPILVEDVPSRGDSSRTACLDLVAASDGFVLIVGERGGYTAPSGKLVVEEEWEEARRRKQPVRVFVQEGVARDAEAARLAAAVSDYTTGLFRRTFTDPASLEAEVERAVGTIDPLPTDAMAFDADALRALALDVGTADPHRQQEIERTLRFVLAPERAGEMIDPRRLDEEAFHHAVMVAAQDPAHRLIAYGQPVKPRVRDQALVIQRTEPRQNWQEERTGRIEIHESGLVVIDVPLEPKPDTSGMGGFGSYTLDEPYVEARLTAAFRFAGAVYDLEDPHLRYERLRFDVAVAGVHDSMMSRTMGWQNEPPAPLMPLQAPRTVSRHDLAHPGDEVSRVLTYLRRKLSS